jgi:hypothetical protein
MALRACKGPNALLRLISKYRMIKLHHSIHCLFRDSNFCLDILNGRISRNQHSSFRITYTQLSQKLDSANKDRQRLVMPCSGHIGPG